MFLSQTFLITLANLTIRLVKLLFCISCIFMKKLTTLPAVVNISEATNNVETRLCRLVIAVKITIVTKWRGEKARERYKWGSCLFFSSKIFLILRSYWFFPSKETAFAFTYARESAIKIDYRWQSLGDLEINADREVAFEIQRNRACALIRLSIIDLSLINCLLNFPSCTRQRVIVDFIARIILIIHGL